MLEKTSSVGMSSELGVPVNPSFSTELDEIFTLSQYINDKYNTKESTEMFIQFLDNEAYAYELSRALARAAVVATFKGLTPKEDLGLHMRGWAGCLTGHYSRSETGYRLWKFFSGTRFGIFRSEVPDMLHFVDWDAVCDHLLQCDKEIHEHKGKNFNG